ncbi:MAG: phosphatidylserine decarboxylase [Desulfobacteraceae bacterium]|nr:MAG: phosphatidylserine decarboxylase [Desulfobacteraceae bacterium]
MQAIYPHQYVHRETSKIMNERLFADRIINFIYSSQRENTSTLFHILTSARVSGLLAAFNYDIPLGETLTGGRKLLQKLGVDLTECVDPPATLDTARKVFERKIKYWEKRPMPEEKSIVVSPADAKMIAGSFADDSLLFIKEKFFHFEELIGPDKTRWLDTFRNGDFAVFRLTPEKYHYNHAPVTGRVLDIYEIDGRYHSCNPAAVIYLATPFSKNKRVVTVMDTDVEGGTGIGRVAMIEIAALMIGDIVQCYSETRYDAPRGVKKGLVMQKGQPKSLYRPGSSVDVLIFEKNRIQFSSDILHNRDRKDIQSRFSRHFSSPLVETEVTVRSAIAAKNRQ